MWHHWLWMVVLDLHHHDAALWRSVWLDKFLQSCVTKHVSVRVSFG